MMKFNIIIPTVKGREKMLESAIDSVNKQTFKNWQIFVIHDGPNPETAGVSEVLEFGKLTDITVPEKVCAGGCRNRAIDMLPKVTDEFTYCLDDDDYLADEKVLEDVAKAIESAKKNDIPVDMVRGGYIKWFESTGVRKVKELDPAEQDLRVAVGSMRISASCKFVRNDKMQYFPEGIKHQDVVNHIMTCDNCETCVVLKRPFFVYRLYERPDKDIKSKESQKILHDLPYILNNLILDRPASRKAANVWINKIKSWYGAD
jgi:glycosyltransferase involved in cell wall biosynthesis